MNNVRPGKEGTDFSIQIVITHLGSLLIAALSGKVASVFGYKGLFTAEIMVAALTFLILVYVLPMRISDSNINK